MSKKTFLLSILPILTFAFLYSVLPVPQVSALQGMGRFADKSDVAATGGAKPTGELSRIQQRADTMIADRIAALQKLLSRVQGDARLTTDEKTTFATEVNNTIQSLTTLKAKIDADTDPVTARADAKTIVTSYKVFAFLEPQLRLLVTIDNLQTESGKLASLSGKIGPLLTQLQGQGTDVTKAQTALADINTQLTAINTLLTTDKTLLTNTTISTTSPQSIFVQIRKDMATVQSDFAQIKQDLAQIRTVLHINTPKGTVTIKPTESQGSESAK